MTPVRIALVATLLALPTLFGACSSEGKTPTCPPVPLYDVHDEAERDEVRSALLAAKDCLTLPVGLEGGSGN
jgi:hypothetical protein